MPKWGEFEFRAGLREGGVDARAAHADGTFLLLAVVRIADSAMIYQYLAKEAARAAQGDDAHACSKVEVARTNMVSTEVSTAAVLYRAETRDGPSPGRVRVALEGALGGSCALFLATLARARC